MPKSRVRSKAAYTPPPTRSPKKRRSAPWVGPTMLGCFLLGVVWLAVTYVTGTDAPVLRSLGQAGNLAIGFGLIITGFVLSTQWR
ncbi:MAG TPA: cell division protein CrgA [Mycobacteriales bacterium]|nr:cell division protein CrgA [Mycobacteriales bacterium]